MSTNSNSTMVAVRINFNATDIKIKMEHVNIDLVVKQVSTHYEIESVHTYDLSQLNGYKILNLQFKDCCDKTEDTKMVKDIIQTVPDINKLTHLKLSMCNLKEIPVSFNILKLRFIDLSHNKLKSIPLCFYYGLKDIERLNLSHNKVCEFDREPMCINKLKVINISYCHLKTIPKWLVAKTPNIQEIIYSHNSLQDFKGIAAPSNCNLKYLDFTNATVNNGDLEYFTRFPLKYLNLSNKDNLLQNSHLKLELLLENSKFTRTLEKLYCNNLSICDIPEIIHDFTNIQELHLEENSLIKLPDGILKLVKLRVLNVSKNTLFSLPDNLYELSNLEMLMAAHNMLCNINVQLPQLKYIDLYSNEIDEVILPMNIEYIDLDQNNFEPELVCNNYENKRTSLRELLQDGSTRKLGSKVLETESSYSDISNYSSCSASCEDVQDYHTYLEPEDDNWECYNNVNYDLISKSDDEFTGDRSPKPVIQTVNRVRNDLDYLYIDAD